MHFDFVAKKSESLDEISLIDSSTFTICLICELLIVDDQRNSVRERLHTVFVDSSGFIPAFWIHQAKAETDRLKIQTIEVERVEVFDLYLPVVATVNVDRFPIQDIELCNEIKFLIIMYSPNRLHDNIVSLYDMGIIFRKRTHQIRKLCHYFTTKYALNAVSSRVLG